jgi:hypothetical protein
MLCYAMQWCTPLRRGVHRRGPAGIQLALQVLGIGALPTEEGKDKDREETHIAIVTRSLCCHVLCCHVMCCAVMCCHVMCCHVMCCHVMSCHVMCYAALRPNFLPYLEVELVLQLQHHLVVFYGSRAEALALPLGVLVSVRTPQPLHHSRYTTAHHSTTT